MTKVCALPKSVFPVKFKVTSPVHALELARKLIRPFKHWTVGVLATDSVDYGNSEIGVKSPKAEAFCALGALRRVNTIHGRKAEIFLQQAAAEILGEKFVEEQAIFEVNDENWSKETHKTVLKMFARAIALAKKAARK